MDIFIARQGIYNINEEVVAYELLYRDSLKNNFNNDIKDEVATYKVIENISYFGLDILTDGKKAFVNFPEELINKNIATLLPKDKVVVEILETVNPTKEVLDNLSELKSKGYEIALDDVENELDIIKFAKVIDIVKVDFILSNYKARRNMAKICKKLNIKMLAEKIETIGDLEEAKYLGFELFQGFYYSKPSILLEKDITVKNNSIFMILVELIKEDFDIDKVENIMKTDVALTYKFLKFINSSYFSFLNEIGSIKQAIMLIGRQELKKWLSILSVVEIASSKSDEYAKNTVIRAKFSEGIAEIIAPKESESAFMVGLFSNLHIMIEKDINYFVNTLPVTTEIREALLGKDNILRNILDLVLAYEKIEKEKIVILTEKLNINKGLLWNIYSNSLNWSKKVIK
ncbi:HDOD domain-containing protein [Clostridium sp.]|uniref:EAL and HDOD domain-containing protein n=1 Tax=Clostridium sp. TaxID=1506 RepID=UPI0026313A6E|nr:HDOD domain-containing protein [Clostridium sp.]